MFEKITILTKLELFRKTTFKVNCDKKISRVNSVVAIRILKKT